MQKNPLTSERKSKMKRQTRASSSSSSADYDVNDNKIDDYLSAQLSTTSTSTTTKRRRHQKRSHNSYKELKKANKYLKVIHLRIFPEPNSDLLKAPMDITLMINFAHQESKPIDLTIPIRVVDNVTIPIYFEKKDHELEIEIEQTTSLPAHQFYSRLQQMKKNLSKWKEAQSNSAELIDQIEREEDILKQELFNSAFLNENKRDEKTLNDLNASLTKLENLLVCLIYF